MNWLPLKRVLIKRPMFWVCERSNAASTSSRMYIGAGEYCKSARMRESAIKDLGRFSNEIGVGRERKES